MRWLALVSLMLAVTAACTREESAGERSSAPRERAAAREASAAKGGSAPACDENASVQVDLDGNWIYGSVRGEGPGTTTIQQRGSCVRMSATWTPHGDGPHYSIEGTIQGQTVHTNWDRVGGGGSGTIRFEVSQNGNSMNVMRATGGFPRLHWTRD